MKKPLEPALPAGTAAACALAVLLAASAANAQTEPVSGGLKLVDGATGL
jgi:hypothetical protein